MITPLKFFFFFSLLVLDSRWAIIQRNRKCLKSFLSTRFYFILFCLLGPKGPSTERVEFLFFSPTVPWTKTPAKKLPVSLIHFLVLHFSGCWLKIFFFLRALDCQLAQVKRFTGKKTVSLELFFCWDPPRFFYFRPGEERNFRSISRKWFRNQKGKKGNWKFELEILDSWRADAREWLIGCRIDALPINWNDWRMCGKLPSTPLVH